MANKFEILISAIDKASGTIGGVQNAMGKIGKTQDKLEKERKKSSEQNDKDAKKAGKLLSEQADKSRKLEEATKSADAAQFEMFSSAAKFLLPGSALWMAGKLADDWGKTGQEIVNTSANIGISGVKLQQWRGAAELAGVSSDSMDGALGNLSKTLQDAEFGRNSQALVMMNMLGIGVKRTKSGVVDTTAAMLDLSRVISQTADPNIQREIASAFGLESALPLLRQGPQALQDYMDKMREFGMMSKEQQAQAAKTAQAFTGLKLAIEGLWNSGMSAAVDSGWIDQITKKIEKLHNVNIGQVLKTGLFAGGPFMAAYQFLSDYNSGPHSASGKIIRKPQSTAQSYGASPSVAVNKFAQIEQKYGLPKNILAGMWGAESSFGKNQYNPTSGTIGNFQWKPGTAQRYGVTPGNLDSEADGVGRYLSDLHKKRGSWKEALYDYNGVVKNYASGDDYINKIKRIGRTGDLDSGNSAPTFTLEQLADSIKQAMSAQAVHVHVSGLPAGATVTQHGASTMPTRIAYNMPSAATP
jgi:hypothetical protein